MRYAVAIAASKDSLDIRKKTSEAAFLQFVDLTKKWLDLVICEEKKTRTIFYYDWEWLKNNRKAKIPE